MLLNLSVPIKRDVPRTYTDTTAPANTSVYYRIMANNTVGAGDGKLDAPRNADGSYGDILPPELSTLTPGITDYANVTANSNWATVSRLALPIASITSPVPPAGLAFPNTTVGSTSAALTATLRNTGNGVLNIASIATSGSTVCKTGGRSRRNLCCYIGTECELYDQRDFCTN